MTDARGLLRLANFAGWFELRAASAQLGFGVVLAIELCVFVKDCANRRSLDDDSQAAKRHDLMAQLPAFSNVFTEISRTTITANATSWRNALEVWVDSVSIGSNSTGTYGRI